VVIRGRVAIKNQSNTPAVVKQGTVIENDLLL